MNSLVGAGVVASRKSVVNGWEPQCYLGSVQRNEITGIREHTFQMRGLCSSVQDSGYVLLLVLLFLSWQVMLCTPGPPCAYCSVLIAARWMRWLEQHFSWRWWEQHSGVAVVNHFSPCTHGLCQLFVSRASAEHFHHQPGAP